MLHRSVGWPSLVGVGLLLGLAGCGPGATPGADGVRPKDSSDRYRVYAGASVVTIESVRTLGDTIEGQLVPKFPASADTGMVWIPISTIDSTRRIHADRNALVAAGLPFMIPIAILLIWRSLPGA